MIITWFVISFSKCFLGVVICVQFSNNWIVEMLIVHVNEKRKWSRTLTPLCFKNCTKTPNWFFLCEALWSIYHHKYNATILWSYDTHANLFIFVFLWFCFWCMANWDKHLFLLRDVCADINLNVQWYSTSQNFIHRKSW